VGNLFIVACLLWVTVQIPGMMRRYATRGQNSAGLVLRMLLIRQLSRLVRLRSSGRDRTTGTGAAATGAPAPTVATTAVPYWRPRMPRPTPAGGPRPTGEPSTPAPAGGTSRTATGSSVASGRRPADGTSGTARRTVPAGTTPATATPPRRPSWQAYGTRPSGTGWPDPPPERGALGNRPAPAGGRPSGTGWPGSGVRPASDPRYPVSRQPRRGGRRGR
jgi:hypothetical protein